MYAVCIDSLDSFTASFTWTGYTGAGNNTITLILYGPYPPGTPNNEIRITYFPFGRVLYSVPCQSEQSGFGTGGLTAGTLTISRNSAGVYTFTAPGFSATLSNCPLCIGGIQAETILDGSFTITDLSISSVEPYPPCPSCHDCYDIPKTLYFTATRFVGGGCPPLINYTFYWNGGYWADATNNFGLFCCSGNWFTTCAQVQGPTWPQNVCTQDQNRFPMTLVSCDPFQVSGTGPWDNFCGGATGLCGYTLTVTE